MGITHGPCQSVPRLASRCRRPRIRRRPTTLSPCLVGGLLLCVCLFVDLAAAAPLLFPRERVEDLRTGRFYHGGTRVRAPFLGISFVVPHEWRVRVPAGARVVHMDSAREPGLGIILLYEDSALSALEERLNEPLSFEEAYFLDLTGPIAREGSRLEAEYLHGDQAGRAVALLGPANQAVVFMVAGPQEQAESYDALLDQVAASTQFLTREAMVLMQEWYGRLAEKSLARHEGEQKTKVRHEYHFCGDGRFLYRFQPGSASPAGAATAGFEEGGRWRLEVEESQITLLLTAQDSLPRRLTLQRAGDAIVLDGQRFSVTFSSQCI